jgi:serine/threonine-protein kinase
MFHEGKQIGSYTLIKKLGKGGFGEVWLAEKRSQFVTKKVAVKLPLDEQVNLEAIRQEAELWEQASGHANVLPIIDADIIDGQVVIVSEYAEGGSLADKLKRDGKLPIKQAVEMTIGVLNGLEYLHNKRIIHRDIKPANILLQGETPRLADFGISRAMRTTMTSQSQNISGTFAYMSPEALDGRRSIQTDIWAVGVNLYEFLTGSLPFPQKEPSTLLAAIMLQDFVPLSVVFPKNLKNVVANALAKQPVNRYASAGEMLEDLTKVLRRENVSLKTLTETETVVRPKDDQSQIITSQEDVYQHQSDPAKLAKSKIPKKIPKKSFSLMAFTKIFIGGLFLAGILVLLINYFENYSTINKFFTKDTMTYTPTISPTPIYSTETAPNKEITPSPTRKKNKINNANGVRANTNGIQEIPQSQKTREMLSQQEQALEERNTFQNLQNDMLQIAQQVSRARHKSSNLQQCQSSGSNFVIGQIQYENLYTCVLKGKIFGVRSFEVSVKVSSEITRQGNNFTGRVIDASIIYDREF